jgi:hypothetical protein
VAITAHLPKEVRNRLKKLAIDLARTMNDLVAEGLDDLFRRHRAPRSPSKDKESYNDDSWQTVDCRRTDDSWRRVNSWPFADC